VMSQLLEHNIAATAWAGRQYTALEPPPSQAIDLFLHFSPFVRADCQPRGLMTRFTSTLFRVICLLIN
jgi:hypothetical protein